MFHPGGKKFTEFPVAGTALNPEPCCPVTLVAGALGLSVICHALKPAACGPLTGVGGADPLALNDPCCDMAPPVGCDAAACGDC